MISLFQLFKPNSGVLHSLLPLESYYLSINQSNELAKTTGRAFKVDSKFDIFKISLFTCLLSAVGSTSVS